jgi:predicted nuclease of predicted toxin-antitoxin system
MKLLVDMNLSPRWAQLLTMAGHEAVHWATVGKVNAPDTEIMRFAQLNDYVVFTHDLDFSAILAATHGSKPSVIQVRSEDVSPEFLGALVLAAIHQTTGDLKAGALVTLDPSRVRVRVLPLDI